MRWPSVVATVVSAGIAALCYFVGFEKTAIGFAIFAVGALWVATHQQPDTSVGAGSGWAMFDSMTENFFHRIGWGDFEDEPDWTEHSNDE